MAVLGGVNTQLEPRLLVINFLTASKEMQDLQDIEFETALQFPLMCAWVAPLVLTIRSDPAPGWKPHPSHNVPFHRARQDRLLVLTLWVAEEVNWKAFVVFLPSSTVISKLETSLRSGQREFEWEEWGPDGTRFVQAPFAHSSVWVCFVHGMAFVHSVRVRPGGGSPYDIRVLDFNPLAFRKQRFDEMERSTEDDHLTQIHSNPETVDLRGDVFKSPVITTLPYRVRTVRAPPVKGQARFTAVMLSEDSIVLVCNVSLHSELWNVGLASAFLCVHLTLICSLQEGASSKLSHLDILRSHWFTT